MSVYQKPQIPVVQFPHWITAPGQCSPIKFHPGQLTPDFYPPDNYTPPLDIKLLHNCHPGFCPQDNFH